MEDRTRHPLRGLGVIVFAGVLAFFALGGPTRAKRGLRLLGLWSYLAVVNRSGSDTAIALDAQRISADVDTVMPYWGAKPWPAGVPSSERPVETAGQPA